MRRRQFLASTAALLAGACGVRPTTGREPKRILILGGTNYVGPHLVRAAQAAGHEVTIFNRGRSAPPPSGVEFLRGDRLAPDGLAALGGNRRWDAVVDTWSGHPHAVDDAAALLADRADTYVYTSSIAVYMSFRDLGIAEDAAPAPPELETLSAEPSYTDAKLAAEGAIARHFGERAVPLRCTAIFGSDPHGDPDNQSLYWPLRVKAGGDILAPDDPSAVTQLIDVKDVADFAIHVIESGATGPFNLVGPAEPLSFPTYLTTMVDAWRARPEAASNPVRIEWVAPSFLIENEVAPFDDLPGWIPANDAEPGFYRISNARAIQAGLTFRPLRSTFDDIFDSIDGRSYAPEQVYGLDRAREQMLLRIWEAQKSSVP